MTLSRKEFLDRCAGVSAEQLAAEIQQQYGVELRSKSKAQVMDDAFAVYKKHELAGALEAPKSAPSETASAPTPVTDGALVYEGRLKATHHAFQKCGFVFGRKWASLGVLSAEQVATLRKYPLFCEIRIAQ